MAGLWYRAGTVAVTNASKKVVGTGTTWKSGVSKPDKGHLVWGPDGKPYELDYVESDTVLYLVTAYTSATASGMAYAIDIARTGTTPGFSRELSAFVAYHQLQMDGWQQLLTGTGDVTLTAPDGTKLTVPSWEKIMNAGSGVVAQAKTEADRAKSEAAAAATSAASASNAVSAAALPLPDVWAPLSDSLRLTTGYGRDVLVGSDVVARMVNFSRSTTATYIGKDGVLKTAAANEPRFEKEGLLNEWQSTNLFKVSDAIVAPSAAAVTTTVVTDEGIASFTSIINKTRVIRAVQIANAPGNTITLQTGVFAAGKTYTVSCWCRTDVGASMQFRLQPNGFSPAPIIVTGDKWTRASVTFTLPSDYASAGGLLFSINQGEYLNIPLYFTGLQVEESSSASSYITTSGSAVARAGDAILLPYAGNGVPLSDMQMTMSAVINVNMRPAETTSLIDAIDVTPNIGVFITSAGQIDTRIFGSQWLTGIAPDMKKEQIVALSFNGSTGEVSLRVGDNILTTTIVVPKGVARSAGNIGLLCRAGTNSRTGFGSVRDFKMWHKFFTVAQLKAIR